MFRRGIMLRCVQALKRVVSNYFEVGVASFVVLEEAAIAQAMKNLPDGVKQPKPKFDIGKSEDALRKSIGAFQKGRDDLEAKLGDMQDACQKLKNTIKQETAFWDAQEFGQGKDAAQAKKIISDQFDFMTDQVDQAVKSMDDLEKMLEKVDSGGLIPWMKM